MVFTDMVDYIAGDPVFDVIYGVPQRKRMISEIFNGIIQVICTQGLNSNVIILVITIMVL